MMYMKPTPFPKLTSERGRQKYLWISPLWISVRVLGSCLARSPSLVKKPLGPAPPFVRQWHSFTENWSEVEHSASTRKYCYFWEEETARGREGRGKHGGRTRLTVLETKCLHRKLNIHSKEAEIVGNSVAQLCPAAGQHARDGHQEYSLLLSELPMPRNFQMLGFHLTSPLCSPVASCTQTCRHQEAKWIPSVFLRKKVNLRNQDWLQGTPRKKLYRPTWVPTGAGSFTKRIRSIALLSRAGLLWWNPFVKWCDIRTL